MPTDRLADPIERFFPALLAGDAAAAASILASGGNIDTPLAGRVAADDLPAFVANQHAWLTERAAQVEPLATWAAPERVAHELLLRLRDDGGQETEVPVLVVADRAGERFSAVRVYHSTWPLSGGHLLRPPLLTPGPVPAVEPIRSYERALAAGDIEAIDAPFAPEGSIREPAGGAFRYAGADRRRFYEPALANGGIPLRLCTVTAAPGAAIIEYVCDEWGNAPIPAQAGAAVYATNAAGKLLGVRIYDDVTPPMP